MRKQNLKKNKYNLINYKGKERETRKSQDKGELDYKYKDLGHPPPLIS